MTKYCLFLFSFFIAYFSFLETAAFAQLQPWGLDGVTITSLVTEKQDYEFGGPTSEWLFAGSDTSGVHSLSVFDEKHTWSSSGLSEYFIQCMTLQRWGVGPMDGLYLMAATQSPTDTTRMFRRELRLFGESDSTWWPADSGLTSEEAGIGALAATYYTGHRPPQPVFAGGYRNLFRGLAGGRFWESVWDEELRISGIDAAPVWLGNLVWACGTSGWAIYKPVGLKSTDYGMTWERIALPIYDGNSETTDIIINTRTTDSVFMALPARVVVTADGGTTWETVFEDAAASCTSLAIDPLSPNHLFIGAGTLQGGFLLLESIDGGHTWLHVTPGPSQFPGRITRLAFVNTASPTNPNLKVKALFIGTEKTGVWKYTPHTPTGGVTETDGLPMRSELLDVYPNPFREAVSCLVRAGIEKEITVEIRDLLGRTVSHTQMYGNRNTLIETSIDGKRLTRGLYLVVMRTNTSVQIRSILKN